MKDKRKKVETESTSGERGAEAQAAPGTDAAVPAAGQPAAAAEGAAPATEPEASNGAALAQRRVAELEDRVLRLQADFDNYRKRMAREREDLWRQAHGDVIGELLTVVDHLDLALKSAADHQAPAGFVDGFRLVRDQFMAAMQKYGLKAVDAEGNPFDPTRHEAVAHLPSDAVAENHVMAQTRRGFMLGDRLLRPAQVVVSRGVAESEVPAPAPADAGGIGSAEQGA